MRAQLKPVRKKRFHGGEDLRSIESTWETCGFSFDAPSVPVHPFRAAGDLVFLNPIGHCYKLLQGHVPCREPPTRFGSPFRLLGGCRGRFDGGNFKCEWPIGLSPGKSKHVEQSHELKAGAPKHYQYLKISIAAGRPHAGVHQGSWIPGSKAPFSGRSRMIPAGRPVWMHVPVLPARPWSERGWTGSSGACSRPQRFETCPRWGGGFRGNKDVASQHWVPG